MSGENLNRSDVFNRWRDHLARVRSKEPRLGFVITSWLLPVAFSVRAWGCAFDLNDNDNEFTIPCR